MVLRVRGRRSSPARRHGYMRSAARLRRAPIPDRSSSAICGTTPKPAVSDTASSVAGTVSDVTSSAAQSVSDVVDDVAGAISDAAGAAADAVKGLLNSALDTLTSAFNAVVGKIGGAWDGVTTGVTNAVESAMQGAIVPPGRNRFASRHGSLGPRLAGRECPEDGMVGGHRGSRRGGSGRARDCGGSHRDGRCVVGRLEGNGRERDRGRAQPGRGADRSSSQRGSGGSALCVGHDRETADECVAHDRIGVDLAAHLGVEGHHRRCRRGRSSRAEDQERRESRPSSRCSSTARPFSPS